MNSIAITHALRRWWFTIAVVAGLLMVALLATPTGQALAGGPLQALTSTYFTYLSLVFKS